MISIEERISKVIDTAAYLQLIGSFDPELDFRKIKDIVLDTYSFFRNSPNNIIQNELSKRMQTLEKMAKQFIEKYPPKNNIREIATSWNELFKEGNDVYSYGITYGWLEELMNIDSLNLYKYVPYNFKIGLGAHKGYYSIEEDFILRDAFNFLLKSEYYYDLLLKYGEKEKKKGELAGKTELTNEIYKQITEIKEEVAAFCRLTIISFYSFIEGFVNSIGYSYLHRNKQNLTNNEMEILKGLKKGRFLSLKLKIEQYQRIIRKDKKIIIVISDKNQIKEPFINFFKYYEELRNSSVHYSPLKELIWLKSEDWIKRVQIFSKLAMDVGLEFWKKCFDCCDGPNYLDNLNYDKLYQLAKNRLDDILKIEMEINEKKNNF